MLPVHAQVISFFNFGSFRDIIRWLEFHGKVTEYGRFAQDAVTSSDALAALEYVGADCGDVVHVIVRVGPARYGQAEQLEGRIAVFARVGIAVGQEGSDFDAAHATLDVYLDAEGLGHVLFLGNLGQKSLGVHEDRMAAERPQDGNAVLHELRSEPRDLSYPGLEVVELGRLAETHRQCAQIPPAMPP